MLQKYPKVLRIYKRFWRVKFIWYKGLWKQKCVSTDANGKWELAKLEWTLKCRNAETILCLNGLKWSNQNNKDALNLKYSLTWL